MREKRSSLFWIGGSDEAKKKVLKRSLPVLLQETLTKKGKDVQNVIKLFFLPLSWLCQNKLECLSLERPLAFVRFGPERVELINIFWLKFNDIFCKLYHFIQISKICCIDMKRFSLQNEINLSVFGKFQPRPMFPSMAQPLLPDPGSLIRPTPYQGDCIMKHYGFVMYRFFNRLVFVQAS